MSALYRCWAMRWKTNKIMKAKSLGSGSTLYIHWIAYVKTFLQVRLKAEFSLGPINR